MTDIERLVEAMRQSPANVRFSDLCKICNYYFGEARQRGSSHRAYKTPWPGDPRANVQNGKGRKTKAYQVRQVIPAIDKLKGLSDG